jgi:hypothetical protein
LDTNFQEFGKAFQRNLSKLIFQDRAFSDQMMEVLETSYLELKFLQVFVGKVFDYKRKYQVHPGFDIFKTYLTTELSDPLVKKQVLDFFNNEFPEKGPSLVDGEAYIKETSLDFCKKQKLKEAMLQSVDLLQKCSFDEVATVINNALKLGTDQNLGFEYLVDFEQRFMQKSRSPVATGWPILNGIMGGGLGKGELGVCISPTGGGKSMALVHLGAHALKAGKNVVHITLELSDVLTASRYDACITGFSLNHLAENKEKILETIQKDCPGRLIIKEYPTKSASTRTIRAYLDRLLMRGFKPDLLIIDYGDLLKSVNSYNDKRHELEGTFEELRAISKDYACPVYTATQTNRGGLNEEVITMFSIAEAFSKCFCADFIFTLSRTFEDKQTNSGRIYIAKSRIGPDGMVFPIFMSTETVTITVYDQDKGLIGTVLDKEEKIEQDAKKMYKLYNGKRKHL